MQIAKVVGTVVATQKHRKFEGAKLLPWWDPLRGDPRFEKIVNYLAPKL